MTGAIKTLLELIDRQKTFPADEGLEYPRQRQVDLIVLHGHLMSPDHLGWLATRLTERPDVQLIAEFPEQGGSDPVFQVKGRPGGTSSP